MDFFIPFFYALIPLSVCFSVGGCFVLWHKKYYVLDGLSHSVIFVLLLGEWFKINNSFLPILVSLFFFLLFHLKKQHVLIVSYGILSLSFLLLSLWPLKVRPMQYLFGDIFLIKKTDIFLLSALCLLLILGIYRFYNTIILWTFDKRIAKVDGINTNVHDSFFAIALSILSFVGVQSVGSLLFPMILIAPTTIVKNYATSVMGMILITILINICFLSFGVFVAYMWDIPSGISISTLYFLCYIGNFFYQQTLKSSYKF